MTPPHTHKPGKDVKEIEDGIDRMALGLDKAMSSMELGKHPSELKNYINKDLMQKLDANSPLKSLLSSKTGVNSGYGNFQLNDLGEQSDHNEISPYNLTDKHFEFSDDKAREFEITPIKMNLLEKMENKVNISESGESNNSVSTNPKSKYNSFNSPNIFAKIDPRSTKKSLTAERVNSSNNVIASTIMSTPYKSQSQNQFDVSSQNLNSESPSYSPNYYYQNQMTSENNNSNLNSFQNQRDYQQIYYQMMQEQQQQQQPQYQQQQPQYQQQQQQPQYQQKKHMQNSNQQQMQQKNYYNPPEQMMYNNQNQNQNMNFNANPYIPQMNKKPEKKKKVLEERAGDWVCMKCKNLNFSFRIICNRCKIPKAESEKLYEEHIKSLYHYIKVNEMYQNQVLQNYPNNQNQMINNMGNVQSNQLYPQGYSQNCNNLDVYSTTESLNNGYN